MVDDLHTVTFDCWSTLLHERDPESSFQRRLEATSRFAPGSDAEAVRAALGDAWQRHSTLWQEGHASGCDEIARWTLEKLGEPDPEAARELGTALGAVSLEATIEPLDGAGEALERLADAGVRRALICDTGFSPGHILRQVLDGVGLLQWLEVCIFSNEVGVPKPDASMFHAALTPLGAEAGRSVHVGDLRRTDVAGARAVGMRTVRIRWHHDDASDHPDADAVADSHGHLLEILGITNAQNR